MVYAAIDIHKHVFHAAALDVESGEMHEQRFAASREALRRWASDVNPVVVAIEATCGWRWVVRELQAAGLEVQLADPGQAVALKGKRRRATSDTDSCPQDRSPQLPRPRQPRTRPLTSAEQRPHRTELVARSQFPLTDASTRRPVAE